VCVKVEGCCMTGLVKASRAESLYLDAHPAALHLTPDNQRPSTAHHRRQLHTYVSLELLMMGIEVPETC